MVAAKPPVTALRRRVARPCMVRFLNRKSQRNYRLRFADTYYNGIDRGKSYNIRSTAQERKKSLTTGKALNGKPYAGNPQVRVLACWTDF